MPSAYLWPDVAAVVDEPWLPTIAYPARGTAELWSAPTPPPDALARLLGRTRALVLASLDRSLSTTALAALIELSPAGTHAICSPSATLDSSPPHGMATRSATVEPSWDPLSCTADAPRCSSHEGC
jgi:hypothetical protein